MAYQGETKLSASEKEIPQLLGELEKYIAHTVQTGESVRNRLEQVMTSSPPTSVSTREKEVRTPSTQVGNSLRSFLDQLQNHQSTMQDILDRLQL